MEDESGTNWQDLIKILRWILLGILCGALSGGVGTLFYWCIYYVTGFRQSHAWLVYLLPLAGLLIAWMYNPYKDKEVHGTDLVIDAIHTDHGVPWIMAPLIFASTVLTHLFGGSAGREGAALQLGGSLGYRLASWLHLPEKDGHILVLCGMAGCFSALFGTPVTAVVFVLEVISVGVMHYSALVPCSMSALTGFAIAQWSHAAPTAFVIDAVPAYGIGSIAAVLVLSLLCGLLSILFCTANRKTGRLLNRWFPNPYLRIAAGGVIIIVLYWCFGSSYLGAGGDIIAQAIAGKAVWYAFLVKLLFTAVTLGAGYKGGEIVPAFFVGATFGCAAAPLLGLPASMGAAIGFICVFCGITNCPITSFLLSIEVFGISGSLYFLGAVAIAYAASGYASIYSRQKILYSKTSPVFRGK